MAKIDRETLYKFIIKIDGETSPALLDALKQTRKSFDEIDIAGVKLSKSFLQLGQNPSFGGLLDGINAVQQGAVSASSAVASLGIGIAASLGSKAIQLAFDGLKWGLETTVDLIKDGVEEASKLEDVMLGVAKVTPGLRNPDGTGRSALYNAYEQDIREAAMEFAPLGYAGMGDIYGQAARGGIGDGLDNEGRRLAIETYSTQTAKQSLAWETSPEQTAMYTRDWMTKMNLTQEQVNELADVIDFLEDRTNSDAGPMAQMITEVGNLALRTGMSTDELAAIATISGVGGATGDASELATTVRNMITNLTGGANDTDRGKFRGAAQEIGFSDVQELYGAAGEDSYGALTDVLRRIEKLNTADAQTRVIRGLFGRAAVNPLMVLLDNVEDLDGILEQLSLGEHIGNVDRSFVNMQDTLSWKRAEMDVAWNELLVEIGTPFMEGLKDAWDTYGPRILENIPTMAKSFADLAETVFEEGGTMDALIELIPRAVELFSSFVDEISFFLEHPMQSILDALLPGNMLGPNNIFRDDGTAFLDDGEIEGNNWGLSPTQVGNMSPQTAMMMGWTTGEGAEGKPSANDEVGAFRMTSFFDKTLDKLEKFNAQPPSVTNHNAIDVKVEVNAADVGGDPAAAGEKAGEAAAKKFLEQSQLGNQRFPWAPYAQGTPGYYSIYGR